MLNPPKPNRAKKNGAPKEVSEAAVERQLELARRIEARLQNSVPAPEPERPVFIISAEDGKAISACSKGDERAALEWLMQGLHSVLAAGGADAQSSIKHLEAVRATFLTSAPKTPLETMLLAQAMIAHHMSTQFAAKALNSNDSAVAGRLAERSARFMDTACRQTETILKLRGETVQQRMVVQHTYVGDGGQAIVGGQVNGSGKQGG